MCQVGIGIAPYLTVRGKNSSEGLGRLNESLHEIYNPIRQLRNTVDEHSHLPASCWKEQIVREGGLGSYVPFWTEALQNRGTSWSRSTKPSFISGFRMLEISKATATADKVVDLSYSTPPASN